MEFIENEGKLSFATMNNIFLHFNKNYSSYHISERREEDKICFETIRKFKGLTADSILIVDSSMSVLRLDENKHILYVGT